MSIINTLAVDNNSITQTSDFNFDVFVDELKKIVMKIVDVFEKHVWPYLNAIAKDIRSALKIVTVELPAYLPKLADAIAKLGIVTAITVLFDIKSTYLDVKSFCKNVELEDVEGAILSGTTALADAADTFGDIGTVLTALETGFGVSALAPVNVFFSLISLPLTLFVVGYSIVKGIYNLIRLAIETLSFPSHVDTSGLDSLKQWLDEKIEVSQPEIDAMLDAKNGRTQQKEWIDREIQILKDRKRNILTRRTDAKIVNIMDKLKTHLANNPTDVDTANKALDDMKTLGIRKIGVGVASFVVNSALVVSLVGSKFFGFGAVVTPAVVIARSTVNAAISSYQTNFMDKGLQLPHFAAA